MVFRDVQYASILIALILIIRNVHNANRQILTVFDAIKTTLVFSHVRYALTVITLPMKANVSILMAVFNKIALNALILHKNVKYVFKASFSIHNHLNARLAKQAIK